MREQEILRKLRHRDSAALEELMDRYIPYVSAIVWNILQGAMPKEDAEEVVSDVFLAAWEQAEDIRPGFVKAWLGAVARNKAKNSACDHHEQQWCDRRRRGRWWSCGSRSSGPSSRSSRSSH